MRKSKIAISKHLFVVVSHPDKDHMNLIPQTKHGSKTLKSVLPDGVLTTVLLEGDWLRKKNKEENALSMDVTNVLNHLKNRNNVIVAMPFYWEGLSFLGQIYDYDSIMRQWLDDKSKSFQDTYKIFKNYSSLKSSVPFCKYMNLKDIVMQYMSESNYSLKNHFDYFYKDKNSLKTLDNIRIAHSHTFDDVNSQSALVEVKLPSLKLYAFLTGDAHDETFQQYLGEWKHWEKEEGFVSLVMLPHHGSIHNKSFLLFDMFKPDILAISAGNGVSFKHPSHSLMKDIGEALQGKGYKSSFYKDFGYFGKENLGFFTFDEDLESEKSKKSKAHFFKDHTVSENKGVPILCTNLLGTIKITKEAFQAPFSSFITSEDEGVKDTYCVDFRQRIEVKGELKTVDGFPHISEKSGMGKSEYYFQVEIEDSKHEKSLLYYQAYQQSGKPEEELHCLSQCF